MSTPDSTASQEIAGKLSAASLAWAKTFLICAEKQHADLEAALFSEVQAFAICLLKLRLARMEMTDAAAFVESVRAHCRELRKVMGRRRVLRPELPAAANDPADATEFARQFLVHSAHREGPSPASRELFEEFCRSTGMSSTVLVGGGENLASLLFYIVIHGVFAADGHASRQQVTELLRAAQKCRGQLNQTIENWMARDFAPCGPPALGSPASSLGLGATPDA